MSEDSQKLINILRDNFGIYATPFNEMESFDLSKVKIYQKYPDKFNTANYGIVKLQVFKNDKNELYNLVICADNFPRNDHLFGVMLNQHFCLEVQNHGLVNPIKPIAGYFVYKLTTSTSDAKPDLKSMDSNEIINNLDKLLNQGYGINEIVSALDEIRTIANYDLLVSKGATNIDLDNIKNNVEPIVVLNNLETFDKANIPIDITAIINGFDEEEASAISSNRVEAWVKRGVNVQIIADKYINSGGLFFDVIQTLLDFGAKIDPEKLVDNIIENKYYIIEDFDEDRDIKILKNTGASEELIHKLRKRVSELTIEDEREEYNGPFPDKLDINEGGKQTNKIFFVPQIQVVTPKEGWDVEAEWAGRILPGQTISEGIAKELDEVYGYKGKFEWRDPHFKDWAKDNQGKDIQRFKIYITLYPSENELL